jgi:8-oxo-dGTP diphosphatase
VTCTLDLDGQTLENPALELGETLLLLLRHARAGTRLSSPTLDRARPLSRHGRAQARRLPEALAGYPLERIVTSPHARCVETVEPLAEASGLGIECREGLAPDASRRDVLRLLRGLPADSLLCTHREVIERLFDGDVTCEKGGAWLLERKGRRWVPVAYLPPPRSTKSHRRRAAHA